MLDIVIKPTHCCSLPLIHLGTPSHPLQSVSRASTLLPDDDSPPSLKSVNSHIRTPSFIELYSQKRDFTAYLSIMKQVFP